MTLTTQAQSAEYMLLWCCPQDASQVLTQMSSWHIELCGHASVAGQFTCATVLGVHCTSRMEERKMRELGT